MHVLITALRPSPQVLTTALRPSPQVVRGALSVALCVEGALGPQMFGADGGRRAKLGQSGPQMLDAKLGQSGPQMLDAKLGESGPQMLDAKLGESGPQMLDAKLGQSGPQMLDADGTGGVGAGAVAGAANANAETNPIGSADFGAEEEGEPAVLELVATLPDQHATLREELLRTFRAHLGRRRAAGPPTSRIRIPHLAGEPPTATGLPGLELRAADTRALPAARQPAGATERVGPP